MSDASTNPPPESPKKPPLSRGRKWRRRLIITLVVLLALSIVGRVLVSVLLPPVLRKVAGGFGLTATYDKLDLYALSGDVGLWNLRFTPLDGSKPVVSTSYCRASISPWALLRGRLTVNRAEAEDAEVLVERNADGTVPLLQRLAGQSSSPAAAAPVAASKPSALSLDPPLTIDVLRLQNGRAHLRDASVTPATDVSLQLDVIVTNVGSRTEKTRMELRLYSPEALVALYVNATGTSRNNQLDADLAVKMYGLNLLPAAAYLAPMGIVPVSNNISARMTGHLQAHINPPPAGSNALPSDLAATLALTDLQLASDNHPVASVGAINIDMPSLSPGAIRVASIDVTGVSASAARTKQGRLAFGGIELVPVTTAPAARPVAPPPAGTTSSSLPIMELKKLTVKDIGLAFDDAAMADPAHLAFQASTLAIERLSTDPAQASQPTTILVEAAAPGIVKTIKIVGTATPAQATKRIDLTLSAAGISPTSAAPYLAAMGLANELSAGNASCTLFAQVENKSDGSLLAGVSVKDIHFTDGDRELFGMQGINVSGAAVNADASRIKIASIAIDGPILPIQRDAAGAISVLGIRLVAKAGTGALMESPSTQPAMTQGPATAPSVATIPTTSPSVAVVPATRPNGPAKLTAIEIDQLAWHGASIVLHDLQAKDPLKLALQDVNVDVAHLVFDPDAKTATPGTVRVTLRAPGVVDSFNLDGTITAAADSLAFEINGQSTGISALELKSLLAGAGVEPVMQAGSLKFTAAGAIRQSADRFAGDLTLSHLAMNEGQTKWLSLDTFQISNASFDGQAVSVDAVRIDKPSAVVMRSSEGLLSVAGFKLLPAKSEPTTQPSAPPSATSTRIDLSLPIVARLKSFKLNDANLQWQDSAVLPATNASANVSISADNLAIGEDVAPSPFTLALTSPGVIDSLKVDGHLKLAPQTQQFDAQLTGTGVYGQSLEPYLPPNAKVDFNNGRFTAKVEAALGLNPAGGSKGTLAVTGVQLSDGVAQKPVAGVTSIRINADRIDLPAKQIALDEISVNGVQLAVTQDEQGLSLLGLTLAPKALRPVAPALPPAAEPIAAAAPSDVNAILAASKEKAPLITLNKLSIQADRLSFSSPTTAKELALVGLSLTNSTPIELLGDNPARRPPFDLKFRAGLEQLVDSIAVDAHLAPLANEPSAKINLDVTGIHANELEAFLPKLKEIIDGQDLSNGRFATTVDAQFKFTRRGPMGIDLSRDISTDITIKHTQLTQAGVDQPLAGVQEIRADGVRYSPVSGSVVVKSIDIDTPMARVVRDAAGIHTLGLTLKTPPPSTQPSTAPAEAAPPAAPPAAVAEAPPASQPAAASAEMRIDHFRVTGVDFVIEDHLGTQPTVLPINALDVDVKGLSTRALKERKPIRFSAIVGAGKVSLPAVDPKNGETTQDRPVFSEASAAGNLVLVPKPKGYLKLSLSGLEMSAIRGLASQADIKIDRGTFDLRTDVRLEGGDNFDVRVFPTFNELRISEPPNGLIQRILKLPAPLDIIVSTLEDSDGSISLPVNVPLQAGKLDTGVVIDSAVTSVGRVIGDAMLAAPLKAANLIAMIGGIDTTSARSKAIPPIVIEYAPGESQLTPTQQKIVDGVLDQLRKDETLEATIQHTLSNTDVTLAEQRSNPLTADSLALASSLRLQKEALQQQQAEQTSRLRVALASQNQPAVDSAMAALRATSIDLKGVDDGLEQVLSLLQPGADRQTQRRTKAAAILLGDLRLRAVQQEMLQSDVKAIAEHVRKANALFNPDSGDQPGRVTIVLVRRAKS